MNTLNKQSREKVDFASLARYTKGPWDWKKWNKIFKKLLIKGRLSKSFNGLHIDKENEFPLLKNK